MHVWSRDGSINCWLVNTALATHGPTNTVSMSCSAPAGGGTFTNAVVVISGL